MRELQSVRTVNMIPEMLRFPLGREVLEYGHPHILQHATSEVTSTGVVSGSVSPFSDLMTSNTISALAERPAPQLPKRHPFPVGN